MFIIQFNKTKVKSMVKKTHFIPTRRELLEVMSGRLTKLQQLLHPRDMKKKISVRYIAEIFGCSPNIIRKLMKVAHDEE